MAGGDTALTRRPEWQALRQHCEKIRDVHLRTLFADDPQRGERLTAEAAASTSTTRSTA